jgi:predicted acyltransferase
MSGQDLGRQRLLSLDQFRGYTILGMLLVNFLGGYAVCPRWLRHTNDYCSYADTIMPQFLFAAGFALRLSLVRRWQRDGVIPWGRLLRRILGLALVAVVWYSVFDIPDLWQRLSVRGWFQVLLEQAKRDWFQTLMHIAATSLWLLPVILSSVRVRLGWAVFSGVLHVVLSGWFNFVWVHAAPRGIDGGPLGFLTWVIPAVLGTVACDVLAADGAVRAVGKLCRRGLVVMVLGWLISFPTVLYDVSLGAGELSAAGDYASDPVWPRLERWRLWDGRLPEPPLVPPPGPAQRQLNYWMMSQRAGSLSYTTFAGGLSLFLFAGFVWLCDVRGWSWRVCGALGANSLAAYMLHDVAAKLVGPWLQRDSSPFAVVAGWLIFAGLVYGCCRLLQWKRWYLRV